MKIRLAAAVLAALALVITALPAAACGCDQKEPLARAWQSPWRGDPLTRFVVGDWRSEAPVRYVLSRKVDGERRRSVKDVPPFCVFRTGWWKVDAHTRYWVVAVYPDGSRERLIDGRAPTDRVWYGYPYRGYLTKLECMVRPVSLAVDNS